MRQRNLGGRGRTQSRSHARNNLERNVALAPGFYLTPRSTEDQRIATLQPDNAQSGGRQRDHQTVDLTLQNLLFSAALANVVNLGGWRNQFQDLGRDQVVVQNRFGSSQQSKRLQCQQLRVTRPCAYQINSSIDASSLFVLIFSCSTRAQLFALSSGILARAASNASRLARECSNSHFAAWSRSLARMSRLVSPSCSTHAA